MKLLLLMTVILAGDVVAEKCDGQHQNWTSDCPSTECTQPCWNQYKKQVSSTGCGALWLEPCYDCCVDDTASSTCNPDWGNCCFGKGRAIDCPHDSEHVTDA